MRLLLVALVLALAGCASPSHPLSYVSAGDPIWELNPGKWNPPGGNNSTQSPVPSSGRLQQQWSSR